MLCSIAQFLLLNKPLESLGLQLVIQLAKAKGVLTVNVVRNRPDFGDLETYLKGLGADVVTTDDKLKQVLGEQLFTCSICNDL